MKCWLTRQSLDSVPKGQVLAWYLTDDGTWLCLRKGTGELAVYTPINDDFVRRVEMAFVEVSFSTNQDRITQ